MKTPHFQSIFAPALDGLFRLRQALGYNVRATRVWFLHFDRFAAARSWDRPYLTRDLAESWVASGPPIGPRTRAQRIHMMRLLGRFLARTQPETYIPPPVCGRRRDPGFRAHIYTSAELDLLLHQVGRLTPSGSLRPKTYVTLFSLLISTGLRIAEALALNLVDVDLDATVLTVREGKFRKSRALPLHPSAIVPLEAYRRTRTIFFPPVRGEDAPFFVNQKGRRLSHSLVCAVFLQVARAAGLRAAPGLPGPRIHDIRHRFAVTRLLLWYGDGQKVQARMPLLSTYMGHVSIVSTQVYLEAAPELLAAAAARFQSPELASGAPSQREGDTL